MTMRTYRGFTLIELMFVIVIIGILATIAIPNLIEMMGRAKEGATKNNMHTLQVAAEDYAVTFDGFYSTVLDASHIADRLPGDFKNPFDFSTGSGGAWENRTGVLTPPTSKSGLVSYAADSTNNNYNIKGYGRSSVLNWVATSGQ